jgi:heme-degrading monooxygenase HmoA
MCSTGIFYFCNTLNCEQIPTKELLKTPPPPYYAVIFTSKQTTTAEGYTNTAIQMFALAATQEGYLGVESFHNDDGLTCTISYWKSAEALQNWTQVPIHKTAQDKGRANW